MQKKPTKKKSILVKLGAKVKYRRFMLSLTQEQLSVRCNMHPNYIGGIERGVRNPSFTSLIDLANGLNCTVAELFPEDV